MREPLVFATDLGWMGLIYTPHGLRRLVFDQVSERDAWQALDARPAGRSAPSPEVVDVSRRLVEYARGSDEMLADVPIDWTGRSPFQVRVLQACRAIPWGETRTYAQLAVQVGSPRAARAVGSVMANNRVPLVIPCHRVVGSRGSLGGFSSRTGLRMKRRLLQLESVARTPAWM